MFGIVLAHSPVLEKTRHRYPSAVNVPDDAVFAQEK